MDLLFRLSQEEFDNMKEAKNFFAKDLLKRDNSYFFHPRKRPAYTMEEIKKFIKEL